jgi:acetyltransferase-like isoleucine patch superfamily enzyme
MKHIIDTIARKSYCIFNRFFFGSIGINSQIIKPFLIYNKKNIFLGKNVLIRNFARIEPIKAWKNQIFDPKIIMGDNVTIEQGFHLTCANRVIIEDGCVFSSYCMVTDIDHAYKNINLKILDQELIVKETIIGKNTFLGTGAKIMAGITVGEHVIVGANAVVTRNIPDYSVAVGIPAMVIKIYNFKTNRWEQTNRRL